MQKTLNKKANYIASKYLICFFLLSLLNAAIIFTGYWSFASFGALFIAGVYIVTRPKIYYHPANVIFANYLIYFILPYTLWLVYNILEIEYILPWGMINDWSILSDRSIGHFLWMFLIMYLGAIFLFDENKLISAFSKLEARKDSIYSLNLMPWNIFFFFNIVAVIVFIELSGGVASWLNNYSETYLLNRQGLGVLNLYILWTANFSAFALGFVRFVLRIKLPNSTIWLALVAILISIFAQGIKSRVPMLLFFYFATYLAVKNLKLSAGIFLFLALILMFMFGMYFRSDGFYSTPQLLLEYLQSYFNTIFLHDAALKDFNSGELGSILIGFNKYLEIYFGSMPRESYDLAVLLTQKYFPDQWYIGGGTQQWPIETDLYLSFPHEIFWIIPVVIYLFVFRAIFRLTHKYAGYIIFVYCAELIRMMSIFRSGFLTWDLGLTLFSYCFLFLLWIMLFHVSQVRRAPVLGICHT
jgi:hypothetical protein